MNDTVNFLNLDLNLLVALDALLTERSVTRAADRLVRSQPALSAALKRLRYQFNDDLLTRVGNDYELTPIGAQLRSSVSLILADVERVFATRARFDAYNSEREFVVGISDYELTLLGDRLVSGLTAAAPRASLRFLPINDRAVDDPDGALRGLDGVFLPKGYMKRMPGFDVHDDRWVVLASRSNTSFGDTFGLDDAGRADWVLTYHRPNSMPHPIRQMQMLGIDLRVAASLDSFLALPALVAGSSRVALIQEKLALRIADPSQFRILELPFDGLPLTEAFWWHPTLEHDPGHLWFRSLVRATAEPLAVAA